MGWSGWDDEQNRDPNWKRPAHEQNGGGKKDGCARVIVPVAVMPLLFQPPREKPGCLKVIATVVTGLIVFKLLRR